jgi:hypothetical protein
MDIIIHNFPVMDEQHLVDVEKKYCELLNMVRNGDSVDDETIDWMDSANNWLMTV